VTCIEETEGTIFAALRANQIIAYDVFTGRPVTSFFGHKNFVDCLQVFGGHRPGGLLYSGSSDHTVKAWDINPDTHSYHCVHTYECHGMVKGLKVITSKVDDVAYLFVACWDGYLEKWDTSKKQIVQKLGPGGHEGHITCLWVQDIIDGFEAGQEDLRMFTGSEDGRVGQWIAATGMKDQPTFAKAIMGAKETILSVFGVPGFIYVGSLDGMARSYDDTSCYQDMTYVGHTGGVTALYASGGVLYTGSQDLTVRFWAAGAGVQLYCIENAHKNAISSIWYSDKPGFDEDLLVTASYDKTIKVWPLSERMHKVIQDGCRSLIYEFCEKYDFDGGGTINDMEEFEGCIRNLVFKLGMKVDYDEVAKIMDNSGFIQEDGTESEWTFDEFVDFFEMNFIDAL